MLMEQQVEEIREHLNKAQNPVFFFDNDADGLCSFLLLQRYAGKGRGVPIKSFPDVVNDYFRKVAEFNSDYIFLLDKPLVSKEFFDEAEKMGISVVWIDHHLIDTESIPSFVYYYNPLFNDLKTDEPVTALCYQVTNNKNDLWILVAGCISDKFVPLEYSEFEIKYPDLSWSGKSPFDIYYKSLIGKVAKIINFGLKDRTTNVVNMIRFLLKAESPYEVLEETSKNHTMHHRYKQIESKYQKLFHKAISIGGLDGRLLFFRYGGDMSISGDLANELSYTFEDKTVVVLYVNGAKANISMRGKGCRDIFLEAIKEIDGARGGGHLDAIGGQINTGDIERFCENLNKVLGS